MNCGGAAYNEKVIHQPSVRTQRLGAHASPSLGEVVLSDFGYKFLQAAYKRLLAEGPMYFFESLSGVLRCKAPEPRIGMVSMKSRKSNDVRL
jgi:hypothetical protein